MVGAAGAAEFEVLDKLKVKEGMEIRVTGFPDPVLFVSSLTNTGNVGIGTTNPTTKLEVAGTVRATNITCPGCTTHQVRVTGSCSPGNTIRQINQDGTVVCDIGTSPSLIVLSTATCPSGFQEVTSYAGRFLVGVPAGGALGGTQAAALGELSTASHSHTFTGTAGPTAAFDVTHTHNVDPPGQRSFGPSATVCTYPDYRGPGACDDVVGPEGHGHNLDLGNTGTSGPSVSLNHTHSITPSGTVTADPATPPYVQVRLCSRI